MKLIKALFHEDNNKKRAFIGDNNSALGIANYLSEISGCDICESSYLSPLKESTESLIISAGLGSNREIIDYLNKEESPTVWGIHRRTHKWQNYLNAIKDLASISYKYIPIYLYEKKYHKILRENNFILTEGISHNRNIDNVLSSLNRAENDSSLNISNENINIIINLRGVTPEGSIAKDTCYKIGLIIGKYAISLENSLKKNLAIFLELGNNFPKEFLLKGLLESGCKMDNIFNNSDHFKDSGINSLEVMEGMLYSYEYSKAISSVASSSVATELSDFVNKGELYLISPPYLGQNKAYQKQMRYYLLKGYVHGYVNIDKEEIVKTVKNKVKKPIDSQLVAKYIYEDLKKNLVVRS